MGGSADPEAPSPSPSPSPVKPSPPSADGKRPRRSVQSKLSWGLVKPAGGAGVAANGGQPEAVPPVPAVEEEAMEEVREEPEKGKKKRKPRKSEPSRKVHFPFQLMFFFVCLPASYTILTRPLR